MTLFNGITYLPAADRVDTPWRNGRGMSQDVFSSPTIADAPEAFRWRVSIATIVNSSEFSGYPGIDRQLMPLSPGGLELTIDSASRSCGQYDVVRFAGEAAVAAINVARPSLDLNLMTTRGLTIGSLTLTGIDGSWTRASAAGESLLIVALEGTLLVDEKRMQPNDALVMSPGAQITLRGTGRIAVASVTDAD